MKSPNAYLPTRRLAQQLCVNHEQLLGAVGDLMCRALLFESIYSNNTSAGFRFKNVGVCVHVYYASALLSASLVVGSQFKIHTLIAETGNCRLRVCESL